MSTNYKTLLKATEDVMKSVGKSWDDVEWIGSRDGKYACSVEEYKRMGGSPPIDFFNHYVADDIVIVFKDGTWIDTVHVGYDGAVDLVYMKKPTLVANPKRIKHLIVDAGYLGIDDIEERLKEKADYESFLEEMKEK